MALYNYIIQRRIKTKVLILSMMKHLLFIMTMVCCLCCNSSRQDPTVKIRQSVAKDTLLKSFGILYSDLNKEKIIHLNKRISCILQPVATSNKEENNYFRLKINKDKHTVCVIDSIISIGKIQYNSKTTRIIIPITKDQNLRPFVLAIVDYFVCTSAQIHCLHTIFPQKKKRLFLCLIFLSCTQ